MINNDLPKGYKYWKQSKKDVYNILLPFIKNDKIKISEIPIDYNNIPSENDIEELRKLLKGADVDKLIENNRRY